MHTGLVSFIVEQEVVGGQFDMWHLIFESRAAARTVESVVEWNVKNKNVPVSPVCDWIRLDWLRFLFFSFFSFLSLKKTKPPHSIRRIHPQIRLFCFRGYLTSLKLVFMSGRTPPILLNLMIEAIEYIGRVELQKISLKKDYIMYIVHLSFISWRAALAHPVVVQTRTSPRSLYDVYTYCLVCLRRVQWPNENPSV